MKGRLIIFEAGDGSGKETQSGLLLDRLLKAGKKVRKVAYPNYGSDSSALIKMYLNGEFGSKPGDVSPYIASTFYAVDRFASFRMEWEGFYNDGGIVIADRYTTSNMVHQASKIDDEAERLKYLDWLYDLEFEKFRLPVPDVVLFLDMPPACARELIRQRSNKIDGSNNKDIHERDAGYLERSYNTSRWLADRYEWQRVACTEEGRIRTINEIHEDICIIIEKCLNISLGSC